MKKVKLFEEYIQEATTSWGKMMKGVRAGEGGPWSIVAIQDKKVVGQSNDIKISDLIPAKYEALKKEFPRAKFHIEDVGGGVVWNESLNEEFDISTIKAKDTIELTNTRTGDVGKYTVKRIFGGSSDIKEIEVLTRNKQLLTLYYSKERGLQNFKGDVYESFVNEALAAASQDKLTNRDTLTAKVNATLISHARNGILKKMAEPGGKTHYWNPETKEYVAKTITYNGKGEYLYSDALDADGNLLESYINEAKDATREELMDLMETKYGIRSVRPSEDFDGQTGGIWIAADNDEMMSGNKIFDYYNKGAKYKNGVLKTIVDAVEKKGWWFSWNDPGTIMCWPKN